MPAHAHQGPPIPAHAHQGLPMGSRGCARLVSTPQRQRRRNSSDVSEVVLNLYDFSDDGWLQNMNDWAQVIGTGAFHAAVEVYGLEWSYSATDSGDGLYSCAPRANGSHEFRESIPLGVTFMSIAQVDILLAEMAKEWQGDSYDLIWKNCCHFSDDMCQRLGVGPVPEWVNPTL